MWPKQNPNKNSFQHDMYNNINQNAYPNQFQYQQQMMYHQQLLAQQQRYQPIVKQEPNFFGNHSFPQGYLNLAPSQGSNDVDDLEKLLEEEAGKETQKNLETEPEFEKDVDMELEDLNEDENKNSLGSFSWQNTNVDKEMPKMDFVDDLGLSSEQLVPNLQTDEEIEESGTENTRKRKRENEIGKKELFRQTPPPQPSSEFDFSKLGQSPGFDDISSIYEEQTMQFDEHTRMISPNGEETERIDVPLTDRKEILNDLGFEDQLVVSKENLNFGNLTTPEKPEILEPSTIITPVQQYSKEIPDCMRHLPRPSPSPAKPIPPTPSPITPHPKEISEPEILYNMGEGLEKLNWFNTILSSEKYSNSISQLNLHNLLKNEIFNHEIKSTMKKTLIKDIDFDLEFEESKLKILKDLAKLQKENPKTFQSIEKKLKKVMEKNENGIIGPTFENSIAKIENEINVNEEKLKSQKKHLNTNKNKIKDKNILINKEISVKNSIKEQGVEINHIQKAIAEAQQKMENLNRQSKEMQKEEVENKEKQREKIEEIKEQSLKKKRKEELQGFRLSRLSSTEIIYCISNHIDLKFKRDGEKILSYSWDTWTSYIEDDEPLMICWSFLKTIFDKKYGILDKIKTTKDIPKFLHTLASHISCVRKLYSELEKLKTLKYLQCFTQIHPLSTSQNNNESIKKYNKKYQMFADVVLVLIYYADELPENKMPYSDIVIGIDFGYPSTKPRIKCNASVRTSRIFKKEELLEIVANTSIPFSNIAESINTLFLQQQLHSSK